MENTALKIQRLNIHSQNFHYKTVRVTNVPNWKDKDLSI